MRGEGAPFLRRADGTHALGDVEPRHMLLKFLLTEARVISWGSAACPHVLAFEP